MRETVTAAGFVLHAAPQGEYDKRMTILTKELGKITVFARGARRQASPYLAVCNPFVYGTFHLYEGRSAYTLAGASDTLFFEEIAKRDPGVYYGFYFLELASYYGQENLEAGDMVNLLYATLRAVLRDRMPLPLIRSVFECRMMTINGDFAVPPSLEDEGALYALSFASSCPLKELYSFGLSEKSEQAFRSAVETRLTEVTGMRFRSLGVLQMIDAPDGSRYNQTNDE